MDIATYPPYPSPPMRLNPATLVALRFLAGLSQSALARETGLSQGHISEIERGDKIPRPATVRKLALALGVPTTALIVARD